jgi:transposase
MSILRRAFPPASAAQVQAGDNEALANLDAEFAALYTNFDRPPIAPERLIRASLIQILFSVRSERHLMEQMHFNLLFCWFVGLLISTEKWPGFGVNSANRTTAGHSN